MKEFFAFGALTLLAGRQEGHPDCKKLEWWGAGIVACLEQDATATACCERPEVVASRRCYYIEGGRTTALSQAAETFGRRAGRLAVSTAP